MTKNKLYIISAVLFIIAILLPILLNFAREDAIHVIDHVSFLVAAFCGIVTVFIAILLYDKYGVDQTITDKNLKVVLEIIDELKKKSVIARGESKSGSYYINLNFWSSDAQSLNDGVMRRNLDDKVYFMISYAHEFDRLSELCRDPFAPKEIADAIQKIQLVILPEIKKEYRGERYAIISTRFDDFSKEDEIVGKFNDKDMTLRDYIQNYQAVKTSIKSWLISHNVDEKSLNF